jgi:predicted N-acetyltransferase YhbS
MHVPAADVLVARRCAERGYSRLTWNEDLAQRPLAGADPVVLPRGYRIVDGNATTPRQKADAHARAFGYHRETEFVARQGVEGFALLQTMPDYRPELDIAVVGEGGAIDAFCGIWVDTANRIAVLEPVGTSHACRRKGLARAAVYESCNRARRCGAARAYVGSNMAFYQAIGFNRVTSLSIWEHRTLRSVGA